jgi:hypothetical protein
MVIPVRYRTADEIESEAQHLLDKYARAKQWNVAPPVPIEKLIIFLGLHQEIHDLHSFFDIKRDGAGDLLGAICFKTSTIYVHENIDPDGASWLEGRFNFTLGHEVGHWVLHRDEFITSSEQASLFDDNRLPEIVCRQSDKSKPIEVQANRFASCLLLPRDLVSRAWQTKAGSGVAMTPEVRKRSIRAIAQQFCTSVEATSYRLERLGLLGTQHQPDLGV